MPSTGLILAVLAVFVGSYIIHRQRNAGKLPLPPGPPRLPIIGNLHQAPDQWPWRTYREWSKTYGPVMSVQYGKDTIILLSNHTAAKDLLDRRSNLYSSRPRLVMGADCVSKGNRSVLMPYGAKYRNHQRIQGGLLHHRYTSQYVQLQDLESKQLVFDLLTTGKTSAGRGDDSWMHVFHRYSSSLIFSLAYGKRMPHGNEPEIQNVRQLMDNFLYSARVGTWIVDAIPFLNHLPKFLAPWKRIADEYHDFESRFYLDVLKDGEETREWNFVKQAKTWKESSEMPREELAYCVGIMYEAGSDTTTMALHSFVLAMLTYPQAAKAAQEELDRVVGDRMPTFEDRPSLPGIDACAKETLRWRPVTAGGIPHAIDSKDDEYMGYRIPKGATILANHWAIDHDEAVYGADEADFRPSRWLDDPDLPLASFGYGRRVCTGQHVAMASLYINIARVLWAFDIKHAVDKDGKEVAVDPWAYSQGFNSGPLPFPARFVVRSEERRRRVEHEWAEAEKDVRVILERIESATQKAGVK